MTTEAERDIPTWQVFISRFFVVTALSSLAIGQPLLDLYGNNPTVFSAADLNNRQIWLFVALVILGPPTLASILTTIAQFVDVRLGRSVHCIFCGLFLAMFGLVLTRNLGISNDGIAFIDAALLAALGVQFLVRTRNGERLLRNFVILTPLVVGLFVFVSPAGSVLRATDTAVLEEFNLKQQPDVFMVIFDELGIEPLIRSDGTINAERFPGFAALANRTTWYPDTVAVHNISEHAVPAILTGHLPRHGDQPYLWSHPQNIFTLFGSQYALDVYEPLTSLCPKSLCPSELPHSLDLTSNSTQTIDLIDRARQFGLPMGTKVEKISIQGYSRTSLASSSPAEVRIPVDSTLGGLLEFGYGIPHGRTFTTKDSDGVIFSVFAMHDDGSRTLLFEDEYIPRIDPTVAEWREATVNIASVEMPFSMLLLESLPRNSSLYNWSTWADVRLIRQVEHSGDSDHTSSRATGILSSFLHDSLVVYGHLSLPPGPRGLLPTISRTWGDFGRQPAAAETSRYEASAESDPKQVGVDLPDLFNRWRSTGSGLGQLSILEQMGTRLVSRSSGSGDTDRPPTMYILHLIVPHRPYEMTPDGRVYPSAKSNANFDTHTPPTEAAARQLYQRYLMQVAGIDRVIANLVDMFDEAGAWEDLLFILTSDHGIVWDTNFNPRGTVKDPVRRNDLYRVPFFVSYPGQTTGNTDHCPTTVVDVLPTIAGVLGSNAEWKFDGNDLSLGCPDRTSRHVTSNSWTPHEPFAPGIEDLLERSAYYAAWIPEEGGVRTIASIGRSGHLVGKPIPTDAELSDAVGSWTLDHGAVLKALTVNPSVGSTVPAWMSGRIKLDRSLPDGTEGLLVVNGIVAGVVVELDGTDPGVIDFSSIIDVSELRNGPPEIMLAINHPDGVIEVVGPPTN